MSSVLADLGGTHLRLARTDDLSSVAKYKIRDYGQIEIILKEFAPDITDLYLASAITPRNGMIEDTRFGDESHWTINLSLLKKHLNLNQLFVLNDLEAAAHALPRLSGDQLSTLVKPTVDQVHFDHPPKLLVGIGTGIGHAYLFEKPGTQVFVQRTHGGHIPALGVSDEQNQILSSLKSALSSNRDLIVEDVVSGHGFTHLKSIMSEPDALRLFWEFLGLYANVLVSLSGAYGGLYLTGGMVDQLVDAQRVDLNAFKTYFLRPMVPVVVESLSGVPVYYCREPNMPIVGLSTFA